MVDSIADESIWLLCPDFADEFVWRATAERLDTAREVVSRQEDGKVCAADRGFHRPPCVQSLFQRNLWSGSTTTR